MYHVSAKKRRTHRLFSDNKNITISNKAKVRIRDYSNPASNPINISTPQNPKTGFEFDLVKMDTV